MAQPPSDLTIAAAGLGLSGIALGWTLIVPILGMAAGIRAGRTDPDWRPLSLLGILSGLLTLTVWLSGYVALWTLAVEGGLG